MSKGTYSHYIFGSGAEVPKAGALLAFSHTVLKSLGPSDLQYYAYLAPCTKVPPGLMGGAGLWLS